MQAWQWASGHRARGHGCSDVSMWARTDGDDLGKGRLFYSILVSKNVLLKYTTGSIIMLQNNPQPQKVSRANKIV